MNDVNLTCGEMLRMMKNYGNDDKNVDDDDEKIHLLASNQPISGDDHPTVPGKGSAENLAKIKINRILKPVIWVKFNVWVIFIVI